MLTDLLGIGGKLIDKLIPDKAKAQEAKLKLIELQQKGDLADIELGQKNIQAEAQSKDSWTSRARPTFMYVMYVMILGAIPVGVLSYFNPDAAMAMAKGMQMWLAAIPENMWWTFGIGYTGYATLRTMEKRKKKE